MGEEKNFWSTLPGLVTAIGGAIGASATLVTALYSAGVIGSHTPPAGAAQQLPRDGGLRSENSADLAREIDMLNKEIGALRAEITTAEQMNSAARTRGDNAAIDDTQRRLSAAHARLTSAETRLASAESRQRQLQ